MAKHDRFAQKLKAKLKSLCADRFSYSNFLGSFCGTGRGKIHEVDAGDGQHDQGDDQKYIGIVLIKFLIVEIIETDIGRICMNILLGKQE